VSLIVSLFDQPKIDSHCHILDPARFPYAPDVSYRPAGQEIGTLAQYRQVMDAYGIRHALLVGPNSGYGLDNRCLLDAIAHGEGRFKGIAVVANDTGREELQRLRDLGVVGLAFNATVLGIKHCANAEGLWRRMAELDLVASLQVEHDQPAALRAQIERSGVRVLIDHCGRPAAERGVGQPGFRALLALAATGRVAVKLSGYQKFSSLPPPHEDTRPFLDALLDAFTTDACLWASDWPFLKAAQHLDIGPLLRQVERWLPDAADRNKVLWETPRHWLGF